MLQTGSKFGRLTILACVGTDKHRARVYSVQCECGTTKEVKGQPLKDGCTLSCGCLGNERRAAARWKHGNNRKGYRSGAYNSWHMMKQRCENPKVKKFHNYGGRGIKVCERWSEFSNFLADMGDRPAGMTIERINNSLGYSPDNCKWATKAEQNHNHRRNRLLTVGDLTLNTTQWAKRQNMKYATLEFRLRLGWPPEKAIFTPVRIVKRRYDK